MKNKLHHQARLWWHTLQGEAVYAYHWLTTHTARWHIEGKENITLARAHGRSILWTHWHGLTGSFMMYGDYFMEADNFTIITVGDERGDILKVVADRIGAHTHAVDMQGNPVAAGRAVLHVVKALKQGQDTMIAPDGPDGPAFIPKPGVAFLARKAEATILPIGIWTRHAYLRKRWDRYMIPYPFARIFIVFGTPIFVTKNTKEKPLLEQVTQRLNLVRTRARTLAGI